MNFECDKIQSLEIEFHAAVDDYLAFCKEAGKEPDKEYRGTFNVRVSFGARLSFADNKNQINWNALDLAEEFSDNGDFIISNLAGRISVLIAQITSSYAHFFV